MRLLLPVLTASSLASAVALPKAWADPCAKISEAWSRAARSSQTAKFTVLGVDARDCLKSMPFEKDRAHRFLIELRRYVEFQSTLETLKNPPESYVSSPVDIFGGLDQIAANNYESQFDFDTDISTLIRSANDGHFSVGLCSLGIFTFVRESLPLVSISSNGIELPELYTQRDSELLGSVSSSSVSPIASIEGLEPQAFLAGLTKLFSSQDPDARYNALFPSKAVDAAASQPGESLPGGFIASAGLWPGRDTTSIQFKNGSTKELRTLAYLRSNTDGFTANSGRDLYTSACLPKANNPGPEPPREPPKMRPSLAAGPKGYPEPKMRDPYNQITGYYLDDNETAVLFVRTFDNTNLPQSQSRTFADVATDFVYGAERDGRSKLIIDVSANGGGLTARGYDLFKLFFPEKLAYSAARFRKHPGVEYLVQTFGRLDMSTAQNEGPLSFKGQVKPDQVTGFRSAEDYLGSNEIQLGTRVSSLHASFNFTALTLQGAVIRGSGNTYKLPNAGPFKAQNILIVGDGTCASTCAAFVDLMTSAGVRTLAFGGRPNREPMQAIGGVRGLDLTTFAAIDRWAADANNIAGGAISQQPNQMASANLPRGLSNMPLQLARGSVNLHNSYHQGKDDQPLQFTYQPADCRLFYTAENLARPETAWAAAKAAIWGPNGCVKLSNDQTLSDNKMPFGKKSDGGLDPRRRVPRALAFAFASAALLVSVSEVLF